MQPSVTTPLLATDPAAPAESRPSTRHLDRSLATGIAWTVGMRGVTQAIQWTSAIFVIRLLTPADYGLVAMAGAYMGLVRMISEFGLGAAIVQRRALTTEQIARLNTVSIIFATFCAFISIGASRLIAAFFHEPRVTTIIMVLSVTFILGGIEVVPRSLLKKELKFSRIAGIQAANNLSQALATLIMAALGLGYWALVLGNLVGAFVRTCVALSMRAHPLAWVRDFSTIRSELLFGWHVISARFALYVRQFADVAVVGRTLGTGALGAYNVAWTQANIPVDRVNAVVGEVTPSIFAAAQGDKHALRRYVRILTEGIAFLSFPATIGMALIADHFVLAVLGERWSATINPLRILAVVGALRSITPILSQVLIATENAKKNMQFSVATAIIIPILLLIGSRWGLTGVAAAWLIGHPLSMLPVLLPSALKAIDMRKREYAASLIPAALASVAMAVVVLILRAALPDTWPLVVRFGVEVILGAAAYGLGVMSTYRSRLKALMALFRSARRKKPAEAIAVAN